MILFSSPRCFHTCDESKILKAPPARIFWSRNQFLPISGGVSRKRPESYAAVGIEGASHRILLRVNSEPFLSIGFLTMSGWCVELCHEGSISLLYSLCSSVSVCSSALLQHSRFSSKINSLGVSAFATILHSRTLARAAHSTKSPVGVGQVYSCQIYRRTSCLKDAARLGFCKLFLSPQAHLPEP